ACSRDRTGSRPGQDQILRCKMRSARTAVDGRALPRPGRRSGNPGAGGGGDRRGSLSGAPRRRGKAFSFLHVEPCLYDPGHLSLAWVGRAGSGGGLTCAAWKKLWQRGSFSPTAPSGDNCGASLWIFAVTLEDTKSSWSCSV